MLKLNPFEFISCAVELIEVEEDEIILGKIFSLVSDVLGNLVNQEDTEAYKERLTETLSTKVAHYIAEKPIEEGVIRLMLT